MAIDPKKHEMPTQDPKVRAHNFKEVALGYTESIALEEASRCLNCKNKPCVSGCPVNVNIPDFIQEIKKEIKATVSGLYITGFKGNHGKLQQQQKKQKGLRAWAMRKQKELKGQ